MSDLRCPECGSRNAVCDPKPHRHECLDCGYDGRRQLGPTARAAEVIEHQLSGFLEFGPIPAGVVNNCVRALNNVGLLITDEIAKALDDDSHIIEFRDDGWTIAHPIRERLNGSLFECTANWGDEEDPCARGRFVLIYDDYQQDWYPDLTAEVT